MSLPHFDQFEPGAGAELVQRTLWELIGILTGRRTVADPHHYVIAYV